MRKLIIPVLVLYSVAVAGQKPPLDHSVYDSWQSISQNQISENGEWATYTVNPQQGDGWLYIVNLKTGHTDSVAQGTSPLFSPRCRYIAFQVVPSYAEVRQAKKKKLKEDQLPKNTLQIRKLPGTDATVIARVKSFQVPAENSDWMAYLMEKKPAEKKDSVKSQTTPDTSKAAGKKASKVPEPKGTELVIINPVSGKEFRYPDVTEYSVASHGNAISFIQETTDTTKVGNFRVNVFDTRSEDVDRIFEGKGSAKKLVTDRAGFNTAFLYTADTSKTRTYELWLSKYYADAGRVVDTLNAAIPAGWGISDNGSLSFSDDGAMLWFGTAPKPAKEHPDTLLNDEKYRVDLWSWNDPRLQPMQKKELDRDLKRTFQAVFFTYRNITRQLADTAMPALRINTRKSKEYALGVSDTRYMKYSSWESRDYADYYVVNLMTGQRKLILKAQPSQVMLSPTCKYVICWDVTNRRPVVLTRDGEIKRVISEPQSHPLYDELHDTPDDPPPYGIAGWTENDEKVLVYDQFDIWSYDIEKNTDPVCITGGSGRLNNLRFRYAKLDPEADSIPSKDLMYLTAFNTVTKESGFYSVKPYKKEEPARLIYGKSAFRGGMIKAKSAAKVIWLKESCTTSPDLYVSDLKFSRPVRLSHTNPQQSRYNWMTSQLVGWTSFNGQELQGILYKPADFDPAKKYPMIVYFYERSSDGLYSYFPPAPSASIVNRPFAVSNGYLLFVPDIVYRTGYPGQSCYDAVVSGTQYLTDKYSFIDRERLGLDGQSWGGYQVAWLVTRTDLFKCAYAGAAVVDMISAYGGIRWESGMSRMFQYEHTQSRIGGSLWEQTDRFFENSPIFYVPKINTPLLLMNNDADGAVPWYQGIEFITALRRLSKPAWMLTYNDEAHNLLKRPNRKDLSVRKMQFFDYYLKGAPMPHWMKYGLSQTEKGKIDGYDLEP
ncbi:MAG: prolyl oligopeptidase family serine peptidase [Bacteroidales bacterium]